MQSDFFTKQGGTPKLATVDLIVPGFADLVIDGAQAAAGAAFVGYPLVEQIEIVAPVPTIAGGFTANSGIEVVEIVALNPALTIGATASPNVEVVEIVAPSPSLTTGLTMSPNVEVVEIVALNPALTIGATASPNVEVVEIVALNPALTIGATASPSVEVVEIVAPAPTVTTGSPFEIAVEGYTPLHWWKMQEATTAEDTIDYGTGLIDGGAFTALLPGEGDAVSVESAPAYAGFDTVKRATKGAGAGATGQGKITLDAMPNFDFNADWTYITFIQTGTASDFGPGYLMQLTEFNGSAEGAEFQIRGLDSSAYLRLSNQTERVTIEHADTDIDNVGPFLRMIAFTCDGDGDATGYYEDTAFEDRTTDAGSAGTNHAVDLPATVNAGDLLVAIATWSNGSVSEDSGDWSEILNVADSGSYNGIAVFALVADGTEDGGAVDLTTTGAANLRGAVYRFTAGSWNDTGTLTDAVKVSSVTTSVATNPDPPSVTMSYGGGNAYVGAVVTKSQSTTSGPAGYTNHTSIGTANPYMGIAENPSVDATTNEDPGTFSSFTSTEYRAITWAVLPVQVAPVPLITAWRFNGDQMHALSFEEFPLAATSESPSLFVNMDDVVETEFKEIQWGRDEGFQDSGDYLDQAHTIILEQALTQTQLIELAELGAGYIPIPATYDAAVTDIGSVFARYKMDEASGNIIDAGPNSLDGVATGTPVYSEVNAQLTDGGTGISFDGVSEYFTLGSASDWDQLHTTPEWTFAAWVTWTKGSNQLDVVWGNTTSGTHHGAAVWLDNRTGQDKIVVVSSGDGTTQVGSCPDSVVTSGVPFFLVATCSTTSGGMKIYIDGVDETTVTGTAVAKVGTADNPMVLGSVGGSETTFEFDGQVDDVIVFEKALTPAEITSLYLAGTQ